MFWGAIWIVFLVRMGRKHGSQHLDDIHPSLPCPILDEFVHQRSQRQYLWIIPLQDRLPISTYPDWCARMRGLAAAGEVTLGMHGVYHDTNDEFDSPPGVMRELNATTLLNLGVAEWHACFHSAPRHFAPPGQHISAENLRIVRDDFHMEVRSVMDGLTARIYHCDDTFCPNPILCTTKWLDNF